ncbi:4-diphosphocytidyl-2-C-methyl-D-erythritol kinase [Rhodoferax ferrireducens T118]|uniref:4-diphosphocytidyl-2-C-methyl-D-erythritol kinase n=1 Tax=Albidiferax ferrireducens (strain ATCC BAA-621 / DSM 15236 / T118) TaxID=338969 RepID=ISPE_ALBFT|nr:4-(cytidine 5'-diphospho)-2-C-methyl-D-erythritol kinase [Rhodoferax ferrireducens]Q21XW4.1 RecName: Full=4-diphosphocytidyl-2-C-methyl-D-erythritol kinase; Short=CMK; AltName: Full=4-(cytidine-5'-diphospho)-2-C-methyl-D-erythritol kinase [Rhodoferax ferrireducens T118]ABD69389.1 4-diphosphocytidyl-2-C-methyl-D-erythritol kinase [Rhodoferax ferrireducens T118]
MKSLYDICAPAKLNLFLHITGRRSDGYHLLQSVFMLIDWCDTLHFDLRVDGQISREDLATPLPFDDLVVRAARALKAASGSPLGVHVGIEKCIPAQAGMGGGSSDAASTLLALNHLWRLNFSLEKLISIGLQLGADVPFFLGGHNAWVEGIGEKMDPVVLPSGRFLVVKPVEGLETRLIFSDPALKRDSETAIISGFAANAFGFGRNDLQSVAQRLCPGVTQALEWLASRGLSGRMTGSGSAVFAQTLQDVDLRGAPSGFQVRLCKSLDVHPLVGWAVSDRLSVGSA